MACFIVPAVEAVATTAATHVLRRKEQKALALGDTRVEESGKIPFSRKLTWLNNLLWGGSGLLAFEHLWHGEIVPWFPFLTNAASPETTAAMLHEMATVGTSMAGIVTAAWLGMLAVASAAERKSATELSARN